MKRSMSSPFKSNEPQLFASRIQMGLNSQALNEPV
jgi:hypothetical protein